jgi:dihydroorotase-like cyclic amidohydrolase
MYVLPGGIDCHTHLDMPFGGTISADDFLTGTRAAAFGGTTTIVDFAIQPRGTRMRDALDVWWKKAEGKACIDYGLHMIVTDLGACGLEDMDDLVREGVASFKLFMAYPNVLMVDDATIFKALSQTAKNGALICMHAENGSVIDVIVARALAEGKTAPIYHALTRPPRAEAEAVHRAIAMAEIAGAPVYIVHLSSEDALNEVREARDRGVPAFAETCPQYLLLSIEELERPNFEGAKYVFTPPLRPKHHQPKLWEGLKHDHLQVVSTDHCPFCFADQKILGKDDFTKIPNGGPGIENRLQLMYHSRRQQRGSSRSIASWNHLHHAGAHLRHVSPEGRNRRRQRRRPRHLGPRRALHHQRRHPPHARRLLHVRRLRSRRQRAHRALARRSHRGWRPVPRQTGTRQLSEAHRPRRRLEDLVPKINSEVDRMETVVARSSPIVSAASYTGTYPTFKGSAQIWNWSTGERLSEFPTVFDGYGRHAISPNGNIYVAANWRKGKNGGVACYDTRTGERIWHQAELRQVQGIRFSAHGEAIWCCVEGRPVHCLNSGNGSLVHKLRNVDEVVESPYSGLVLHSRRRADYLIVRLTTPAQRTWGFYNYTALWFSMCMEITTYQLASSLIAKGMDWKQAIGTVLLGNLIVLVPMLLNAHAGAKYGIPFPVFHSCAVRRARRQPGGDSARQWWPADGSAFNRGSAEPRSTPCSQ